MEPRPVTRARLVDDLRALGVRDGMVLLVHASLSSIGWVPGGEQALHEALVAAVGERGTLVMPTQSWQLCDPAYLNEAHVPAAWWPEIRDTLPAFDPARTPTRTMGALAELFRTHPGTLRSAHPHRSFAAAGPHTREVVATHDLDSPVGERSPLRALVDLGGWVLLLGVGHKKSTTLHLAEHRCDYPGKHTVRNTAPILVDGTRTRVGWEELWVADDDFDQVGAEFAASSGLVRSAQVGHADALLMPQRDLVEFAASWFPRHRDAAAFSQDSTAWNAR
ncbi:aminoglycoside N(3)-acetyltransferase [Pengzhenrongella frigida]|nr:AAC(3) family N-acetyltransferase [Cellulomonas sp. HLT2-17]